MCLRACIPKIATKDIQVYKVVEIIESWNEEKVVEDTPIKWRSVVMYSIFGPGDLLVGEWKDEECKNILWNCITNLFKGCITSGYIHSYITEDRATYVSSWGYFSLSSRKRVIKCIIPKGTLYYIDREKGEIASRKLIILQ